MFGKAIKKHIKIISTVDTSLKKKKLVQLSNYLQTKNTSPPFRLVKIYLRTNHIRILIT